MKDERRKRIVTKIGDIFCSEIDGRYKRYFQYIVSDMEQLNSSVIRVFKTHYPMDNKPEIDDIVKDEVEFYAHTVLKSGVVYNAWYKVGKSKDTGSEEYKKILFGTAQECIVHSPTEIDWVDPAENWYVWHINEPHIRIGKLTKDIQPVEIGSVMSYLDIIDRMQYGRYTFKYKGYKDK